MKFFIAFYSRLTHKLPSGRQLARTPAVTSIPAADNEPAGAAAAAALPSGNYNVPEVLQKIAFDEDQNSFETGQNIEKIAEQQKKAEEVRRKKKEEAELKRKKQEIEALAKEEKKKIEEERRQLEEMRKMLQQQEKMLEMEKTKLKREEEIVRRKSRLSEIQGKSQPKSSLAPNSNDSPKSGSGPWNRIKSSKSRSPKSRPKITITEEDFPSPNFPVEKNRLDNEQVQNELNDENEQVESVVETKSLSTNKSKSSSRTPTLVKSKITRTKTPSPLVPNKSGKFHASKDNTTPMATPSLVIGVSNKTPRGNSSQSDVSVRASTPSPSVLKPTKSRIGEKVAMANSKASKDDSKLNAENKSDDLNVTFEKETTDNKVGVTKENNVVRERSSLESMRSKLKKVAEENSIQQQKVKEGIKTNAETRRQSIEEAVKKTELVRQQAKIRRQELEQGKQRKIQNLHNQAANDKIESNVNKEILEDEVSKTVEINETSKVKAAEIPAITKKESKVTIGRKSRAAKSFKDVKDEENVVNTTKTEDKTKVDENESPPKRVKVDQGLSKQRKVKSKVIVEDFDSNEDSPLFYSIPKGSKRKVHANNDVIDAKTVKQTEEDIPISVENKVETKSRRNKAKINYCEEVNDSVATKKESGKRKATKSVDDVVEPTEIKSKVTTINKRGQSKLKDQAVNQSPSSVAAATEEAESSPPKRGRKTKKKEVTPETALESVNANSVEEFNDVSVTKSDNKIEEPVRKKPGRKKKAVADNDNVAKDNTDYTVTVQELMNSESEKKPAAKRPSAKKTSKKQSISKDIDDQTLVPKNSYDVNEGNVVVTEKATVRKGSSSRKSGKETSNPNTNTEVSDDQTIAPELHDEDDGHIIGEKKKTVKKASSDVNNFGTDNSEGKDRPRRGCKKRFENLAGFADR